MKATRRTYPGTGKAVLLGDLELMLRSIVAIARGQEPPAEVDDPEHFFRVVKAAFAQRRKTLLNGLSAAFGSQYSKEALSEMLVDCGLPAGIRGERLGIPEFARLSKLLRQNSQ